MLADALVRGAGAVIFGVGGLLLGSWLAHDQGGAASAALYTALPVGFGCLGAIVAPYLTWVPYRWLLARWHAVSNARLALGALGLILGLIASALLAPTLTALPGRAGFIVPLVAAVVAGGLGTLVGLSRGDAVGQALSRRLPPVPVPKGAGPAESLILDTSAIIDGRIADICQTGFIQGTLVVPRFVLDELRYIADSSDSLRRNRGRRGLEVLTRLQKEAAVPIEIIEVDYADSSDVDGKLVRLAAAYGSPILTNDFNLNRVAQLEGVRVLNVNQLANAVKSVVLPGEEMAIRIIQEGKEMGQGVGFLDDGTMVVVEGGRRHLNDDLDIVVTRVLQTVAGRMIFAQPKSGQ
jgi:uncharacterized protein YacL